MFKNYVIIKDGVLVDNIGGTGLSIEEVRKMHSVGEIIKVDNTEGIVVGLPAAAYKKDYSLKTPEELKSAGLGPDGKSLPTPEQLADKAKAEKLEQEKQKREAELSAAKVELGEGTWTAAQIAARAFKIKQRDLQNQIMQNADTKQKAAYRAILLYDTPDSDRWNISDTQIKRYEVKIKEARNPNSTVYGEKEKLKIIAAADAAEKAMVPLIALIDNCRRVLQNETAKSLTEGRLKEIEAEMDKAAKFTTTTPKAEIDSWAQRLGGWREV